MTYRPRPKHFTRTLLSGIIFIYSAIFAHAGDAEIKVIGEIFNGQPAQAEQFAPTFLAVAPLAKIRAMMGEVYELVGEPIEITGDELDYVVTTATHKINLKIKLGENGEVAGLMVKPPQELSVDTGSMNAQNITAAAIAFDRIIGKFAISAATLSQTTIEFLAKDNELYFKNPNGNQVQLVRKNDSEFYILNMEDIIFSFKLDGDMVNELSLDQKGQLIDFKRLDLILDEQKKLGDLSEVSSISSGYVVPEAQNDGLTTASLTKVTGSEKLIFKLIENIEHGAYGEIDSLLIVKDGKLVVEQYYNYYGRAQAHQMQSVSKSITSLLVGSAIQQGYIKSVDEPIGNYLPKYVHLLKDGKENISIKHLLTMSAGFDWNEQNPPYSDPKNIRMQEAMSEDGVEFTLSRPLINQPGKVFTYSGGYVTVIGAILKNATGAESVLDYLQNTSTLKALNFENLLWQAQTDGRINTAGGVMLRPRDLAKIGQLMLNDGIWDSVELLPKDWVKDSFANHTPTKMKALTDYGYFWWGKDYVVDGKTYSQDSAEGWGGQELLLFADLDLAVIMTANNFNPGIPTTGMIEDFIIPAFK
uniref:Beta-lactamase-related domain-containing protein n=1 Tax=OCS116 cluster bacterium TaxID=2030921 RepID=A0A2A4YX93_9PROT